MTMRNAVVTAVAALALLWWLTPQAIAGPCVWMPDFSGEGVTCTAPNQAVECRCSECFMWDPATVDATHGEPTYYDVERTDMDGTVHIWRRNAVPHRNEDTGLIDSIYLPRFWCPAKDDDRAMPFEGRTYKYRVRWGNGAGFTPWCNQVIYIGAPYAINSFRPPVKGN